MIHCFQVLLSHQLAALRQGDAAGGDRAHVAAAQVRAGVGAQGGRHALRAADEPQVMLDHTLLWVLTSDLRDLRLGSSGHPRQQSHHLSLSRVPRRASDEPQVIAPVEPQVSAPDEPQVLVRSPFSLFYTVATPYFVMNTVKNTVIDFCVSPSGNRRTRMRRSRASQPSPSHATPLGPKVGATPSALRMNLK